MLFLQGSGLGTMVGLMSYGNKKYEPLDPLMRTLIPPLQQTMLELIDMVDKDTSAFNDYMVCNEHAIAFYRKNCILHLHFKEQRW